MQQSKAALQNIFWFKYTYDTSSWKTHDNLRYMTI